MKRQVVRSQEDARRHIPYEPALIEVPGVWVHAVVSLIRASEKYRHHGLLVTNVGPGGEAARVGMARGDLLLRYEHVRLDRPEALRDLTRRFAERHGASKTAVIEAIRGSKEVRFEVAGGRLGVTVSPLLHRSRPRRD